jgi:hypothetical protein
MRHGALKVQDQRKRPTHPATGCNQNAPGPAHRLPVYLRTSATPLVPSTSIQSRSPSKMIALAGCQPNLRFVYISTAADFP